MRIRLCAQYILSILGLIVMPIGRAYYFKGEFLFCGSPRVVQFEMIISMIANWTKEFLSIQTRLFIVEKLDYGAARGVD